jgi:DNA-binding MarR family transcriptional regulator
MSMHHKWFRVIHRGRLAFLRERFGGLDVEPRLLPLLCRLHDEEGLRQEDLRAESGLDKTTVAHAVKRLVQTGYVSRKRSPADGRSYSLALTEKAKALVPSVIDAMSEWETSLTSDFSVDEVRAVDDYLQRMAANAQTRLHPSEPTTGERCGSGPR